MRRTSNATGWRFWTVTTPEEFGGVEVSMRATPEGLDFAGNLIPWSEVEAAKADAAE